MAKRKTEFRPMLACPTPADTSVIPLPIYVSAKLDGIRCVVRNGQAYTRSMKLVPNNFIRQTLSTLPDLDGELMLPEGSDFTDVTSAVMTQAGWPQFVYHVFDYIRDPGAPFEQRYAELEQFARSAPPYVKLLEHIQRNSLDEIWDDEAWAMDEGHEGLILRHPQSPYKFGRSTEKQGWLMKIKRFVDSEGTIKGFYELHHNDNEQTRDEIGLAQRSSHAEGKRAAGTLGGLILDWNGLDVRVGSGFTADQRAWFWAHRDETLGQLARFKYQPTKGYEMPRHAVYLGLRSRLDI